jgi:hypothetical protein
MQVGYFTLDLDFWEANKEPVDEDFVNTLVRHFAEKGHCIAAFDHHHILQHTAHYRDTCNILINQDWHNDLGGYDLSGMRTKFWKKPDMNCGTWADHVWWKNMDLYVWSYPNEEVARLPGGTGRCDCAAYNAFTHGHTDWKKAQKVRAEWPGYHISIYGGNVYYSLLSSDVPIAAMSLVLSSAWAGKDAPGVFMRMVRKHKLYIIDGLQGKTRRATGRD